LSKISNKSLQEDLLFRVLQNKNEAIHLKSNSENQLLHKITEDKWSANQCFEHLTIVQNKYVNNINKALEKSRNPSEYFKQGFIGAWFYERMLPITSTSKSTKTKTFKNLQPENTPDAIDRFLESLKIVEQLISNALNQNLEKTRVVSLAGPILKFKLGDAYRIVIAHNERHLKQAARSARAVGKI